MKFWLPFLVVVLFSCDQEPEIVHTFPEEEQLIAEEQIPTKDEVLDSVIVDSAYQFSIGSYDFLIEDLDSSSQKVFVRPYNWLGDSLEVVSLENDDFVIRDSIGLLFKSISKDTSFYLKDDLTDGYAEYIRYYFEGDAGDSSFWKNYVSLYEGSMMLLVGKNDLDSTYIIGEDYFAPNKQLLISSNYDLEAGFDYNGFQLLENRKNDLVDLGIHEFYDFGFDKIQWVSDTSLVARKIEIGEDDQLDFHYVHSWVRITVSKK